MAKINAIGNKSEELTIDPGASGDSFVQFDINTTGEFRIGVDDNDSDKFKISQGSALGSNDTFVVTDAGERRLPLNSSFLAINSALDSNVTGDGTDYTVEFDLEIFDQNSDYNNSTDTFTAPVTGRYLIGAGIYSSAVTTSHTLGVFWMVTSNGNYTLLQADFGNIKQTSNYVSISNTIFADLDASDTVTIHFQVSNGTKVIDIFGSSSIRRTWFGADLVC